MLRLIEGFDHCLLSDLPAKWTGGFITGANSNIGQLVLPRTGIGCLSLQGRNRVYFTSPAGTVATVIAGFGFRYTVAPPNDLCIMTFGDQGEIQGYNQCGVGLTPSGTLRAYRTSYTLGMTPGDGIQPGWNQLLGTTNIPLGVNQWNYIEVKARIHSDSGYFEIRINGIPALTLPNVNTQWTSNEGANVFAIGGSESFTLGNYCAFDDLYFADSVIGDGVIDFLGPQRVATVRSAPGGAGAHAAWTPSAGSDHAAMVDDLAPNGDVDYVTTTTVGARDSYKFQQISLAGSVVAVQTTQWARLSQTGTGKLNSFARIGSGEHDGPDMVMGDTYRGLKQIWTKSPATTNDWTIAEINAAEFGVRLRP